MIDQPVSATVPAQQVARIPLHIPVRSMQTEFLSAVAEISAVLEQQGIPPIGPLFAHHLRRPTDTFDFAVCLPVAKPVHPSGRVESGVLPAVSVLRTTYHGDYAGLPHAWGDFMAAIQRDAPRLRGDFFETYVVGPHETEDASAWRTELSIILAGPEGTDA